MSLTRWRSFAERADGVDPPVRLSREKDDEAQVGSLKEGDRVYGWFWTDWFPGAVQAVKAEEGKVCVAWDEKEDGHEVVDNLPLDYVAKILTS